MNVWKARVDWERGEIDVTPNWKFALPVWILPSLVGEIFITLIGGHFAGIIAGVGVSLVKGYYDFFIMMKRYIPPLKKRKKLWRYIFQWR